MDSQTVRLDTAAGSDATSDTEEIPAGATCRICRGEATDDNPLFHPCKCKGSIKYIHESCLMEWIASKNIDITKTGTVVHCDICHYPINFKTTYSENMPDRIPMSLLLKRSLISCFLFIKEGLTIVLAGLLFLIGVPLTWNFFGKLYTFILDKELPYPDDFLKSVIFGFDSKRSDESLEFSNILVQVALNYRFSLLQIVMVVILHISLYFQYDMIVRENVFSKMVFHKIGPQYTKEELIKIQLKERFPMMDDETIENVAKIMKGREEIKHLQEQHENPGIEDESEQDSQEEADIAEEGQDEEREELEEIEVEGDGERHSEHEGPEESDTEDASSTAQSVQLVDNNDSNSLESGSESGIDTESEGAPQAEEIDLLDRTPLDAFRVHRAQNELDNILDQRIEEEPVFIPPVAAQAPARAEEDVMVEPVRIDEEINAQVEDDVNQQNPPAPIIINLKLKLINVIAYYIVAVVLIAVYLSVSYLLPTFTGFGLSSCYLWIIKVIVSGIVHLSHLLRLPVFYNYLVEASPQFKFLSKILNENIIDLGIRLYQAYNTKSVKSSIIVRSVPGLVSYVTTISLINISSELISKGFSRENGMKNRSRRFIFQILFAVKCTFKVFTLFFIELAAFPVLTGLMLDFSLFCPLLCPGKIIWAPRICENWPPSIFFVYWTIGTLYMYWFAKYIGMIRKHIIRPGVLFFIRSPDDPNIKILHDSLIHPMSIQISRLCLSMFIYAVFIIIGFGFHTRFLFPVLMNSKMLTVHKTSLHVGFNIFHPSLDISFLYPVPFYFAKQFIESTSSVKLYIRKYWVRVFDVSSRKLRLSSFILGNDIPTERGHVLYRNWFYKLFSPRKAQWSNPELYTSPRTSSQAKQLFQENRSIHAYFIPDGVLMRVPSSDIISRTYVQTLFVPVTKDDKLLKPLDLQSIKERNKRNSGNFGYLDEQNTEYDGYSIVYAPPNFRARYISLLVFVWLFASLLVLLTTFASQFTFTLIFTAIISPVLILPYVISIVPPLNASISRENCEAFSEKCLNLIKSNLGQLDIFFVCFGAIVLALMLERYHEYVVAKINLEEHIIPVVIDGSEIEQNELPPTGAERNNANPMVSWITIFVTILNRDEVKAAAFVIFMATMVWIKCLALVVNMEQLGFVRGYFSPSSFAGYKGFYAGLTNLDSIPINVILLGFSFQFICSLSANYAANRNSSFGPLFRILLKEALKKMNFVLYTTIPIVASWLLASSLEYILHRDNYTSFGAPLVFLFRYRLQSDFDHVTWTFPQHLCFLSITCILIGFSIWQIIKIVLSWFGDAIQNVKDEVYARGRSLENFTNNEN